MIRDLTVKSKKKKNRALRPVFIAIALLLAAILLIVISSLVNADRVMKISREPISPYATNRFSTFRSVSFTSGGGQIDLKGWLIQTNSSPPRGTIIIVHQQGGNRLPYGLQMTTLYSHLAKAGFQILAFDLRHSGESGGEMSSFGYAEAEDVRAALEWTIHNTPNAPIILYGFGSGSTAIFRMMHQLQDEIVEEEAKQKEEGTDKDSKDLAATDIRKRINAMITDSPARSSDDFIKASIKKDGSKWLFWLADTTPYAVRMSLGNSQKIDHFVDFTTLTLPLMVIGHRVDSFLPESAYRPMIQERLRLHPNWTTIYETDKPGHLSSYDENAENYKDALITFLQKWFPAR